MNETENVLSCCLHFETEEVDVTCAGDLSFTKANGASVNDSSALFTCQSSGSGSSSTHEIHRQKRSFY